MKTPRFLKQNDVVDVVAPAFGCSSAELEQVAAFLEGWGLKARIPAGLMGEDAFCAHGDAARAEFLVRALRAEDSAAVWCVRGGWGCQRILPLLENVPKVEEPKWFVGFSDITALHLWLNGQWGWETLHGPTLLRCLDGRTEMAALGELQAVLFGGRAPELRMSAMNPMAELSLEMKANLRGGNLTVLVSLVGTPYQPDLSGTILFLEEVDERGYRLDRLFAQLRQSGMLRGVKAVVLGDVTGGDEPGGENLAHEALARFAAEVGLPVFRMPGVGHGNVNRPLVLGACHLRDGVLSRQ